ncbi:hypothetical protein F4810DRAFT_649486 [Camillea tinctor]|nr:hypothetical protein F4810DRAFT_649486 [Camillea tinctor]
MSLDAGLRFCARVNEASHSRDIHQGPIVIHQGPTVIGDSSPRLETFFRNIVFFFFFFFSLKFITFLSFSYVFFFVPYALFSLLLSITSVGPTSVYHTLYGLRHSRLTENPPDDLQKLTSLPS